MELNDAIT